MRMTATSRPQVPQARVGRRRPSASTQIGGVMRMGGSLPSRIFTRIHGIGQTEEARGETRALPQRPRRQAIPIRLAVVRLRFATTSAGGGQVDPLGVGCEVERTRG
jgi:hypothetical protein